MGKAIKTITFEALSEICQTEFQRFPGVEVTREGSDESLFIPTSFSKDQADDYTSSLSSIASHQRHIDSALQDHLEKNGYSRPDTDKLRSDVRALLTPFALRSKVIVRIDAEAFPRMCQELVGSEYKEVADIAIQLAAQLEQPLPQHEKDYIARTQEETRTLAQAIEQPLSIDLQPVKLLSTSMRNEMHLVPYILYPYMSLSFDELAEEVHQWSYERKLAILESYIGPRTRREHLPGAALKHIEYSWELLCDTCTSEHLRHLAKEAEYIHQPVTPRFGYSVPQIVEEAGVADEFEECFDRSYALYSNMQKANFATEAEYAVLKGHKQRLRMNYNAQDAFIIHENAASGEDASGSVKSLLQGMHVQLTELHPFIANSMKFVNR